MALQNNLQLNVQNKLLSRHALQGAGIACVLAIIFLSIVFSTGDVLDGKPFLLGAWQFFPILTMTIGGLLGGVFYHLVLHVLKLGGWQKTVALVVCGLMYMIILWLSLIAGLSATGLWD